MVLHAGDNDAVARLRVGPNEALSDEVHALGAAAREDHLAPIGCVQEALHGLARGLVRLRGPQRQVVHTAMDVGVVVRVETRQLVDHAPRLLRAAGIVEIDERPAVHRRLQDREVRANLVDVEVRLDLVRHGLR